MPSIRLRGFAPLLVLVACSQPPLEAGELLVRSSQPIQGGTIDKTDTAVVGIMINTGQGIAVCTGSLIAPNLVLTAHHCVASPNAINCGSGGFSASYSPSSFAVTTSYNAAAASFNNGSWPSIDNHTWFSVKKVSVPGSNMCGDDMALIELGASISGICPLVPRVDVAARQDETYTAVGFGITSPNGQTAGTRYTVGGLSVLCSQSCGSGMSSTLEWEGGANTVKGTCEGDSGGPALDAAGRVIGTVSRGPADQCNLTVYESVAGQAAWIKEVALTAASDGKYAAAGWVNGVSTSDPGSGFCSGPTLDGGSIPPPVDAGTAVDAGSTQPGACAGATTRCMDATGAGDYECLDTATNSGFPVGAPTCANAGDCPSGYSCWSSANSNVGQCLQDCTPSTTATVDAGTGTHVDAGTSPADAGSHVDAGSSSADAGSPHVGSDPGTQSDAGPGNEPNNPSPGDAGTIKVLNAPGQIMGTSAGCASVPAMPAEFAVWFSLGALTWRGMKRRKFR